MINRPKPIQCFLVFLFGLLFFQNGVSQKKTTVRQSVYIDPIQILGVHDVSIDFGYTLTPSNRFSLDFNFAYITTRDGWNGNKAKKVGRNNGKGFHAGFTPKITRQNLYFGLYTVYTNHHYESDRFTNDTNASIVRYKVKQQVYSTFPTLGLIVPSNNRFFLDFSLGVGLRTIHIDNDSPTLISALSPLYRLSPSIEPEEKGWHYLLGIKLSTKFHFKIK